MTSQTQARSAGQVEPQPGALSPAQVVAWVREDPDLCGLCATFWLDPARAEAGSAQQVRICGRRVGVRGRPGRGDSFVTHETLGGVVPGSGPVSVTTRVYGLTPGEWSVTATLLSPPRQKRAGPSPAGPRSGRRLDPAVWSWRRWALQTSATGPVATRWAPWVLAGRTPAVIPGSWAGLVTLGIALGLGVQAVLATGRQLPAVPVLAVALLAVAAGLVGAKFWYLVTHPRCWRQAIVVGWSVQGGLAGAVAVGAPALALAGLPVGLVLGTSTPGLLLGLAVGRLGCFFTGCCAGRPTAARYGVWSSDQKIGARRIPTQLLESLVALLIGLTALGITLTHTLAIPAALFVGAIAAYTLARQLLLRLRLGPRATSPGGPVTAGVAALVLAGDVAALLAWPG